VSAIGVIIRDIVFDQTAQVILVEDEYVIRKISATASNPGFGGSILPGTSETGPLGSDAAGCQQIRHILAELETMPFWDSIRRDQTLEDFERNLTWHWLCIGSLSGDDRLTL